MTPPEKADETDNGLLTASEIAQLKLNAESVILSACNTAAGSGRERSAFRFGQRRPIYTGSCDDSPEANKRSRPRICECGRQ